MPSKRYVRAHPCKCDSIGCRVPKKSSLVYSFGAIFLILLILFWFIWKSEYICNSDTSVIF